MPSHTTIRDRIRAETHAQGRDYLRSKQAAVYTGFSDETLRNWRVRGVGPRYQKLVGQIRYRLTDLDAWLDAHFIEVETPART